MWKWAILAGLFGYLILHPLVMISGHLMQTEIPHASLAHVVGHEIRRSFSLGMLPWSITFALGAAIPGGLYGHLRNIERVLRTSRLRYQTVVDDQLDYIYRFRPGGQCTFVNDALCRLIGRSRDSILDRTLAEQAEFSNMSDWRLQVARLSPANPKTEIEQRVVLPDGTKRWIRWIVIAILDESDQIVEYQSVGHDVTAIKRAQELLESHQADLEHQVHKRTQALNDAKDLLQRELEDRTKLEKELRESELKYRMLFESAPMGIALTTFEGRILAANQALLAMLKLTAVDLDGLNASSLYASEEDRRRLLAQLKTDHRVKEAEVELRRLDGSGFYASLNLIRFNLSGLDTILAVVNDITQRRKALEAVQASETELKRLSGQLMTIQEEERKRIAQELHDAIGQLMHALKYSLETALRQLKDENAADAALSTLSPLGPLIQEATAETRRIVMDLRPSMLDDLGVLATVNWFCREFGNIYEHIEIEKDIRLDEADIPIEKRVVFYRIIQEAFNNVAKHSRARRVRLTIAKLAGALKLEVEDNGIGLPKEGGSFPNLFAKGFGLSSMRERARASGGTLELLTTPEGGTRIRAVWPAEASASV